jgi:hypothetical protein
MRSGQQLQQQNKGILTTNTIARMAESTAYTDAPAHPCEHATFRIATHVMGGRAQDRQGQGRRQCNPARGVVLAAYSTRTPRRAASVLAAMHATLSAASGFLHATAHMQCCVLLLPHP